LFRGSPKSQVALRARVPARFTPRLEGPDVSKYELIDHIRRINISASPDFLTTFSEEDLRAYFYQLQELQHELAQRSEPWPTQRQEAEPVFAGLA
jgi:hypothetical protein